MPGAVDAERAKTLRPQPFAERGLHVGGIAGGAVHEQGRATLLALGGPIDDMNCSAVDRDPLAEQGKARFDAPARNGGERPEGTKEGRQKTRGSAN